MATKKKQDWIDAICKLDDENKGLLGDLPRETLTDYTVGQLKALLKDMEADLKTGDEPDGAIVVFDDVTGEKPESKFATMCGMEFDPKKSGECNKQCSEDFPEAFAACSENYKSLEKVGKTKTKSSKPSVGKTAWGHTNGKQGGLIDDFFFNGGVGTIEDVCEFSGGKPQRCMHHMKHLVFDLGVCIKFNFDKVITVVDEKEVTTNVKKYWWADKDKRRKGDELKGKSAYPGK